MRLKKPTLGETAALALSIISIAISIWAVSESRRATEQARWSEFRASTLNRLETYRRAYNRAACILQVGDAPAAAATLTLPRQRLDEVEQSIHELRRASEGTLRKFESQLDAGNSTFRKLEHESTMLMQNFPPEVLERANAICGAAG